MFVLCNFIPYQEALSIMHKDGDGPSLKLCVLASADSELHVCSRVLICAISRYHLTTNLFREGLSSSRASHSPQVSPYRWERALSRGQTRLCFGKKRESPYDSHMTTTPIEWAEGARSCQTLAGWQAGIVNKTNLRIRATIIKR